MDNGRDSGPQTTKLAAEGVSYSAGRNGGPLQPIVRQVSFAVPEASVFTILGPSGSGKSTLLRILNRLNEPDAGRVLLDGRDAAGLPVQELRQRVGMVFQRPAMFEGSVLDNVLYGPRLRHECPERDCPEARETALPFLDRVGLPADFVDKPADELSGGEAQRVSLARALANEPEVLLLDEPTASLDPTASRRIEELLQGLSQQTDLTFVFVTHDLSQARRIGDRGLLLVEGRVVEQGALPDMLDDPAEDLTRLFASGRLTSSDGALADHGLAEDDGGPEHVPTPTEREQT